MTKPFSQACENNKQPILNVLTNVLVKQKYVLEIGSGTGQHAVYFAKNLPFVTWQTSDLPNNHGGINEWINDSPATNLKRPVTIDLSNYSDENNCGEQLLAKEIDTIYSANTLHIISWPLVLNFFRVVEKTLGLDGVLCLYGPFNYQGKFTSESNNNFDLWLKARDEKSGIRDFEAIEELAIKSGLLLNNDIEMPANNRLLIFQKTT